MNRIPGAGRWNGGPANYFVAFSYATPEFKKCLGSAMAVVAGQKEWNGKTKYDEEIFSTTRA
jgi:hypothetical protein